MPVDPEFIKSILSGDLPKALTKIDVNTQRDLLDGGLRAFSHGFSISTSRINDRFLFCDYDLYSDKSEKKIKKKAPEGAFFIFYL